MHVTPMHLGCMNKVYQSTQPNVVMQGDPRERDQKGCMSCQSCNILRKYTAHSCGAATFSFMNTCLSKPQS